MRKKIASALQRIGSDTRGSVAILFALVFLALLGFAGVALDYSRATRARTTLQTALDAAVMETGRTSRGLPQAAQLQAIKSFVTARAPKADLSNLVVNVTTGSSSLQATASGTVATTITSILGFKTLPVQVAAEASWGVQQLEIALVLDNTGSMSQVLGSQTKIQSLIAASNNFVESAKNNSTGRDSFNIGIVPFDTSVNVGSGNKSQWWVDSKPISDYGQWTSTLNELCRDWYGSYSQQERQQCSQMLTQSASYNNGAWQGCVWDRDHPNELTNTAPVQGNAPTLFEPDPLRMSSCALQPVLPLTNNWSAMHSTINGMRAAGSTNLNIGLAWGFGLLTPNVPFTGASPFNTPNVYKALVILTDGWNTQDRLSTVSPHATSSDSTDSKSKMDARTRQTCDNIKKAGVEIYAVATSDADTALLRSCASSSSTYFTITDSGQMDDAFKKILDQISRLRISR